MKVCVVIKGEAGWRLESWLQKSGIMVTPYPNEAQVLIFDDKALATQYSRSENLIVLVGGR